MERSHKFKRHGPSCQCNCCSKNRKKRIRRLLPLPLPLCSPVETQQGLPPFFSGLSSCFHRERAGGRRGEIASDGWMDVHSQA
ncbi:hypothetical protein ACH3XW_42805 [Acanthocheilonema viteae]